MPKLYTLKNCPCCGGAAYLFVQSLSEYYVKCLMCGLRTGSGSKEAVEKAWNRRENGTR